ncbi:radical SAM protein [Rhizobium pusense]|uniref:radical SAM protein n=1 Tax=Agrobacterium pusense TaxID=648995 RepID=UPI00129B4260|nr:radical SAM protein [Agrobacterium pusense]MRG67120.1 radical SAM protein [Agrobacterium pusense]
MSTCREDNIGSAPILPIVFGKNTSVTRLENGNVHIERDVFGRHLRAILTADEALLCALLERGSDPVDVFGSYPEVLAEIAAKIPRLLTALRAFIDASGAAADLIFSPPSVYFDGAHIMSPKGFTRINREIAPRDLVWYATHRCPRTCRYCHWVEKGRSDLEPDHLSLDGARGLVMEAWLGGVERFVITGGEPMLRRDIYDIISYATDLGLPTWLFTRYNITPARAERLAAARITEVYFSLDDITREANASMVENVGVADEAIRSLRSLRNASVQVTVVPVITRLNASNLVKLVTKLSSVGVQRIRPICYKGRRGAAVNDLFTLQEEDKRVLVTQLEQAANLIEIDETTLDLGAKVGICESGISTLYVQPSGSVSYCPLTSRDSGKPFAHLPRNQLSDIWHSARLAELLAANALASASPRELIRVATASSCALNHERLDLV